MISKALLLALPALVSAANDWNTPCTSGTCHYESGDGINSAWSTLTISAEATSSLSDITEAAGWSVVECDPTSTEPQNIRLICVDRARGCDQLFEGGEENTIIRLPADCAGGPFARVARSSWIDENQSLPTRLSGRGLDSSVRGLAIDFNFDLIPSTNGPVFMTVSATNSETQRDALTPAAAKRSLQPLRHATRASQARSTIQDFASRQSKKRSPTTSKREPRNRRFFGFIDKAVDSVSEFASDTVDSAKQAASKVNDFFADNEVVESVGDFVSDTSSDVVDLVQDGAEQAGNFIGQIVDDATGAVVDFVEAVDDSTNFNESFSQDFGLIHFNRNFPIFSTSINCPGEGNAPDFEAGIEIDADVKAKLVASIGFIVTGSIVPPAIDDLAFTAALNGAVTAVFNIKANAKGTFDLADLELFQVGLPGLSFPGILTVGPSFSVNVQAIAELGITAEISVASSFDLPTLELVFPPDQGESFAEVVPKDSPLKLDVGASAELTGRVEVHLIPRIDLGVEILNGLAEATVFLNIDGFAALDFSLQASADVSPVSGPLDELQVSFDNLETSFGGTVGLEAGVSINAGAEAALPPFFDTETSIELFSQTFTLFEKEFGAQNRRRSLSKRQAEGLVCPLASEANANNSVVDAIATATRN